MYRTTAKKKARAKIIRTYKKMMVTFLAYFPKRNLISELSPGILGDELLGLSDHTGEATMLLSYLNMRREGMAQSMMMNMMMVTLKNEMLMKV